MKTKAIKVGEVRFGQGFKFLSATNPFRWYKVRDRESPAGSVAVFDTTDGTISTAHLSDTVLVAADPEFIIEFNGGHYWAGDLPTPHESAAWRYSTHRDAEAVVESLPSYIDRDAVSVREIT